ncbi:MAG: carboxypeptidase-like regulatory domain-containing protein, partial [Muribaculaceae bacterium]
MKKYVLLMLLCIVAFGASAQRVSRNYQRESMSEVLKDLSKAGDQYSINFIYDELEDFSVTVQLHNATIPEAVRKVVGFYPIMVKEDGSIIFVECIKKIEHKFSGRILNEKGQPLEYANIALLNPTDSTFITGGVSNMSGDFVIPCERRDVLAKVSFVGYVTAIHCLRSSEAGNIVMKPASYNLKN